MMGWALCLVLGHRWIHVDGSMTAIHQVSLTSDGSLDVRGAGIVWMDECERCGVTRIDKLFYSSRGGSG